jgi:spore maturation protein SpmA
LVLNYIWIAFFLIAFVVGLVKLIAFGDVNVFPNMVTATFEMAKTSVMDIALPLSGVMTLWLGLMNIGERAGAINFVARIVGPFFSRLFPELPKDHPASGHIIMNFSANMLGLDNAATPLGLKAMQSLQELNPNKETASNAQIMFLVLNTSGLTLIPVSIMAIRAAEHAANPTDIFVPILLATFCSTLGGLIFVAIRQRINLFHPVLLGGILGVSAIVLAIGWHFSRLDGEELKNQSQVFSTVIILSIIVAFLLGALRKGVNAFDAFIEGAKEGFATAVKIIPYLVGILVGIAVFRASGAMDYVLQGIVALFHIPLQVADALPTALMKPLSGSGARGMMIDAIKTHGVDSFPAKLAGVFQGAADTTFYIVALYFGSVGIKHTRYAIAGGLFADLCGVIAAIFIAYLFFW